MARYQYTTVPMRTVSEGRFVRWVKGTPESTLREVLAEYAEMGWRYVGYVATVSSSNIAGSSGQAVFELEMIP